MEDQDLHDDPQNGMKFMDLTSHFQAAKDAHGENEPQAIVEAIISAMKESGMDEASLAMQRKLLEAKFGTGSWQDVVTIQEESLQVKKAQDDVLGQLDTLINLIGTAINSGDKEKARQYVTEADKVLSQATDADIERSLPQPLTVSGKTILQLRRAEIDRLRNWVS
jgi:hypothetical protein